MKNSEKKKLCRMPSFLESDEHRGILPIPAG
jgi:hypothetical protein